MNIPIEKQKGFIEEFGKARPVYEEYATLLEQILQEAVDQLGYLALVQARAKQVASFSNKIIMKDKYRNPLTDMTDLCGARVIVHFQSQVAKVCDFIKENFEIDEANSLDLKSKLKVNEFGYRSIHYIVTPKKETILGLPVDEKFRTLKAEVQVRTLAEHVWADISHDRIYKTELTIPEAWKREAARLAAILEEADQKFADMSQAIDAVNKVYVLQYKTEKAKNDIQKLKTLMEIQKEAAAESVKNVLDLVSVYNALNMPEEAEQLLTDWIDKMPNDSFFQSWLQYELMMLQLNTHFRDIHSAGYPNAIKLAGKHLKDLDKLRKEKKVPSADEMSFLYYRYGLLLQNNPEKSKKALKAVSKALELMPENPLYITILSECILLRNMDMAKHTISLFQSTLEKNITDLKELIHLGIDAIPAWFAVGRCHFFLGNPNECIKAYLNAVAIIMNRDYTSNRWVIDAEIHRAGRFKPLKEPLAEQIRLCLLIALSGKSTDQESYRPALEGVRIRKEPMKTPVVIVAGGASLMKESKAEQYREYIEELMLDFKGTIISGGTTAGIPGLVGKVKAQLENSGQIDFDLLAYLPKKLPKDAVQSKAYDHPYKTDSKAFSALDIFSCWADIVLSGIPPADVILIGIEGGEMAGMEYRTALAFGAKVGLVAYSGRAAFAFINEKPWKDHANLIQLPNDPLTLWALVNQTAETTLSTAETATLAPLVHDFYRRERLKELKPETTDINKYKVVMEWDKLDKVLKNSNIQQVAFYQHILKRVNLGIRKSEKPVLFNLRENLSEENYELLARLEHARWNAERLLEGWKYGPEKDLAKKLNPCLVPWEDLDSDTRRWDYEPMDNIPKMLEKIGYEVFAEYLERN